MNPPPVATREIAREERFNAVWTRELNDVFADVAPYYDKVADDLGGLSHIELGDRIGQTALEPDHRLGPAPNRALRT